MKFILTILLVLAVAVGLAIDPRANNEDNIQYGWTGSLFQLYEDNVVFFSIIESINGADSVAVLIDFTSATYDFAEVFFRVAMTGDATDEDMRATIRWYQVGTLESATAADTLNWINFHTTGADAGKVWFTIVTDSTSRANSHQIGSLLPGNYWMNLIPLMVEATSAADSTGSILEIIANDSTEVMIEGWAILRE